MPRYQFTEQYIKQRFDNRGGSTVCLSSWSEVKQNKCLKLEMLVPGTVSENIPLNSNIASKCFHQNFQNEFVTFKVQMG